MVTQTIDDATELALLDRLRSGQKECFWELTRPYARAVYLAAYSVLRNAPDAEEVAQETFLKAFRHLERFRGECRFKSWLLTIAFNEARMRWRKDRKANFDSLESPHETEDDEYQPRNFADWREIPSESLERKEIQAALAQAMDKLSEKFREVVMLRDVQHLTSAETAEALGISVALVKTRLFRARLRMRDLLADLRPTANRGLFKKGRNPW